MDINLSKIHESLSSIDEKSYGEKYKEHILEQYKIYIDMADKISDRRHNTNNFFLTLNTGIISAIGIAGFIEKDKLIINKDFIFFLTIGLLFFCFAWYRLIRSYKDLNSAKFKVIHEIEKKLPIKPFDSEWEALTKGENRSIYLPFSNIEIFIPVIFALLNLTIMIYLFVAK